MIKIFICIIAIMIGLIGIVKNKLLKSGYSINMKSFISSYILLIFGLIVLVYEIFWNK